MSIFEDKPVERRSWVCITFIGGSFWSKFDPDIYIYYDRKVGLLSHLMLEGDYIDGKHIEELKHNNLWGKIRYV